MNTKSTSKKRDGLTMLGAAGLVALASGPATAQPALEPGSLLIIAENLIGPARRIFHYKPSVGTPVVEIGAGQVSSVARDLPPVTNVHWFQDSASIMVGDGTSVVTFTQFGQSGSEPMGIWGTGGVAVPSVSDFDEPALGFEDPLISFGLPLNQRIAFHETTWANFDEPALGFEDPLISFARPGLYASTSGVYMFDHAAELAPPVLVPGTDSLGTIAAAVAFPPGSISTKPQPPVRGQAAMALLAQSGGVWSLHAIWGTNGTAFDGVDGEAIWGTGGVAIWGGAGVDVQALSTGGLLTTPTGMIAWPTNWQGLESLSFLVADVGSASAARGVTPPRIIGINANGTQYVVSEGNLLVNPQDLALRADGFLLVADPDAAGGDGAIIAINPSTGAQSIVAQGGAELGFRRPVSVSVVRCAPLTFFVNSSLDFVDPIPGDGDPSNGSGLVCLRSAVMEANASACAAGAIIELPAGTFPLTIPGVLEDGCATGDIDVTANVRIRGQGKGITTVSASNLEGMFEVRPGGSLVLATMTVTGGNNNGYGGGATSHGNLALTNTEVTQNIGPGIRSVTGNLVMVACSVTDNNATGNGGGVFITNDTLATISRSLIAFNSSDLNGGGISVSGNLGATADIINSTITGNAARLVGGGIQSNNALTTVDHCTVVNNEADTAESGTFFGGGVSHAGGTLNISNSIVARNSTPSTYPQNGNGTLTHLGNCLFDERSNITWVGSTATLVEADPMINGLADNGGQTLTHRISSISPALDAASPSSTLIDDQRYGLRPIDGNNDAAIRADIGALEFAPSACAGDINGDGYTNAADFVILAGHFGSAVGFNSSGDINGDGLVNAADFVILAGDFGCAP